MLHKDRKLGVDSGLMGSVPQMLGARGGKKKLQAPEQADDRGCAPRYDSASS